MASDIQYIERSTGSIFDIASDVIQMLRQAGETVGIAESLTAGGTMAAITSVPGASAAFRGGVVSYATPLKQLLLNVDADLVAREGVIHGDVAAQMAEGVRKITTFDHSPTMWGIGTTGVAGPTPQDGKPVGMAPTDDGAIEMLNFNPEYGRWTEGVPNLPDPPLLGTCLSAVQPRKLPIDIEKMKRKERQRLGCVRRRERLLSEGRASNEKPAAEHVPT